jgi:hypothetical protein
MLRCAASFVVAAYVHIRLNPQDLHTLPAELFTKPSNLDSFRTFYESIFLRSYKILSGFLQCLCLDHGKYSKHEGVIHERENDYLNRLIAESDCVVPGRSADGPGCGKGRADDRPQMQRLKYAGEDRFYPQTDRRRREVRNATG